MSGNTSSSVVRYTITLLAGLLVGVATRGHAQSLCPQGGGSIHNSRHSDDGVDVRWRTSWTGRDCSVDLDARGIVRFNREFTDIASVSYGGWVELTERRGDVTRRLLVRNRDGQLERRWSVDGREAAWDAEGQRWLGALMVDLDRLTAFAIDYRFPALLQQGGARAVLDETQHMRSDHARGLYLRRLVDSVRLSRDEMRRVLGSAGSMSSDSERSRILQRVSATGALTDEAVRQDYARVIDRMSSDSERSRSLLALLERGRSSPDIAAAAVRMSKTFRSDSERGRVLRAAIESGALDRTGFVEAMDATNRMSSDSERGRVLRAAIEGGTLDKAGLIAAMEAAARMSSDSEKGRVLVLLAERSAADADLRKVYLRAAESIRSDSENRRVLSALIRGETRR